LISSLAMGVPLVRLQPLISAKQIADRIRQISREIDREYFGKDLVILMVLKGAVCIVADLIRAIEVPCDIDFVRCASYGRGGTNRGNLEIDGLDRLNLQNRDVLIVDDIFDSGHTMAALIEAVQSMHPRSVKSLVLLCKEVNRNVSFRPDYVLFEIKNYFVVGFGLDYKERYRGLSGIFIYEEQV
jgi:hypoxanthine phosphoribosyltransferase